MFRPWEVLIGELRNTFKNGIPPSPCGDRGGPWRGG